MSFYQSVSESTDVSVYRKHASFYAWEEPSAKNNFEGILTLKGISHARDDMPKETHHSSQQFQKYVLYLKNNFILGESHDIGKQYLLTKCNPKTKCRKLAVLF